MQNALNQPASGHHTCLPDPSPTGCHLDSTISLHRTRQSRPVTSNLRQTSSATKLKMLRRASVVLTAIDTGVSPGLSLKLAYWPSPLRVIHNTIHQAPPSAGSRSALVPGMIEILATVTVCTP